MKSKFATTTGIKYLPNTRTRSSLSSFFVVMKSPTDQRRVARAGVRGIRERIPPFGGGMICFAAGVACLVLSPENRARASAASDARCDVIVQKDIRVAVRDGTA